MAWTSILSRKINLPIVNLGFSGSGRLDKEVIGLINEIDAQVFILDCLPNMAGGKASFTEAEIYTRIINAVNQIRTKHPKTPIVLTDHFGYTDAEINPVKRAGHLLANRINRQAFTALQSRGEEAISLLSMKELQQDMDTMVDGIHPTDLGMLRYAMAYLRLLQKLLAK
jgi:lysophospholipase L1-like esterase